MKKTKIELEVGLDENHVPEEIKWSAEDGGVSNEQAKAFMLSLWDDAKKESLRIDLWVKDMPMDEMKQFFHQTLLSMSTTYKRATNEEDVANEMKQFAEQFALKAGIIKG